MMGNIPSFKFLLALTLFQSYLCKFSPTDANPFSISYTLLSYPSNPLSCTLNKKVRNAQLAQYNFIFVIGEKEKDAGKSNVSYLV